jgi:NADPH2:quinone reductase
MTAVMRAIRCETFGKIDDIGIAEIATPGISDSGQVLIDVAAAGVNFADTLMIGGTYQATPPPPFTPGLELAGTVRTIGGAVSRVKPGDRVLAVVDSGAFAQQAVARDADVFPIPPGMDFAAAAGFAIAYGTSHGALRWRADLQPGEVLLVHGAAGGVGLTAVEIGKAMGAMVIATAGDDEKLKIAADHGADHLINYKTESIRDRVKAICGGRGADVVFDPVGGSAFDASLRAVNWNARLIHVGFASGQVPQVPANILLVKNIAAIGFYWGSYRKHRPEWLEPEFRDLFQWWREGKLKPHVSHRLPLEEAARALGLLLDRRSTGKVVLTMPA